jgi:hypothetical protein
MTAISKLVEANLYTQALIILYSAIDTLAWSDLPVGDVSRTDFCCWVTTFMSPERTLGCTAEDLYSARCALLQSNGSESKLSREGRASELWYATSPKSVSSIETFAQSKGASNVKVISFTSLIDVFVKGVEKFNEELALAPSRETTVSERVKKWLHFAPTSTLVP